MRDEAEAELRRWSSQPPETQNFFIEHDQPRQRGRLALENVALNPYLEGVSGLLVRKRYPDA
jgi:hypothetical protein